jgi:hypothetical protein
MLAPGLGTSPRFATCRSARRKGGSDGIGIWCSWCQAELHPSARSPGAFGRKLSSSVFVTSLSTASGRPDSSCRRHLPGATRLSRSRWSPLVDCTRSASKPFRRFVQCDPGAPDRRHPACSSAGPPQVRPGHGRIVRACHWGLAVSGVENDRYCSRGVAGGCDRRSGFRRVLPRILHFPFASRPRGLCQAHSSVGPRRLRWHLSTNRPVSFSVRRGSAGSRSRRPCGRAGAAASRPGRGGRCRGLPGGGARRRARA